MITALSQGGVRVRHLLSMVLQLLSFCGACGPDLALMHNGLQCVQKEEIVDLAQSVFGTMERHSSEFLPHSSAYVQTEKLREAGGS